MKTNRIVPCVLIGLALVSGSLVAKEKAEPRADVTFTNPEKFSDAADGPRGSDSGREQNLAELRDYIVGRATRLPAGQKLSVTITEVDLAGEIEPWRNPSMSDVRIVKSIYAPRIDLSFKLTDAGGAVLKEGTRQLRNPTFDMNIYPNRNDARVYEKGLLDDWMRSEFRPAKK